MRKKLIALLLFSAILVSGGIMLSRWYHACQPTPAANCTLVKASAITPRQVTLNNNMIGWGIAPTKDGTPPGVPDSYTVLLNKYSAAYLGDTKKKDVFLTFDEGYEAGFTPKILDVLKANNIKAAFFITGHYIDKHPDLVKRMLAEGHIVGNHTITHPSMPSLSDQQVTAELQTLSKKYTALTGKKDMIYLRPPKGEFSERTLALSKNLGYKTVFWSLALRDWEPLPGGPQESFQTVTSRLHNGAIILLHAISKDNTEALNNIIKETKKRGYEFKTLNDINFPG